MQFKRFFAVLPTLALSTALVAAQEPQPNPPQTQTPQTQTQTTVGQPTDTNEPVYKGCVSGTKDNYMLTTSDGQTFRLHSDKDIAEHVGKMVEIRGTIKKEGADRPADAKPASASSEIDVADLKNIEGSCPSTGASTDMPKTDQQASTTAPAKTDTTASTTQPAAEAPAASTTSSAPASSTSSASTSAPASSTSSSTSSTTASTTASSEPQPSSAVSTQDKSAAVSTDTTASSSTSVPASNATDQNATASAGNEQKSESSSAALPQTASPLPLLGLLGFASAGLGLLIRRK